MIGYENSKYKELTPQEAAEAMHRDGYRQISRGLRSTARVDLSSDDELVRFLVGVGLPTQYWNRMEDYYRRCYSEDRILLVPEEIMNNLRRLS